MKPSEHKTLRYLSVLITTQQRGSVSQDEELVVGQDLVTLTKPGKQDRDVRRRSTE